MSNRNHNCKWKRLDPGWFWEGEKLREWRKKNNVPVQHLTEVLRVSQASYYRYEQGDIPYVDIANRIARITRGAIRYRDIYPGFEAKYA